MESKAQIDTCGVCNGNDSGITMKVNKTLTGSGGFGYHTAAVIPSGARIVRIAEPNTTQDVCIGKISYIRMIQV